MATRPVHPAPRPGRSQAWNTSSVVDSLPPDPAIVAIIATADRPHLLHSRALESVARQSVIPSRVIVVDDSRHDAARSAVRTICRRWRARGLPIERLRNRRTPGASGAWNTGFDHLARCSIDVRSVVVALLDDDDAWAPNHIERIRDAFAAKQSEPPDVVASGFRRREEDRAPRVVTPPSSLSARDLLVGNPGIQPSATAIRLSSILEAGCFDEALRSCTDRDLLIRLADLGARYRGLDCVTADHFACRSRPRLCTPGSAARQAGLDEFWHKYARRMTPAEQVACADRARRYFDWSPPESDNAAPNPRPPTPLMPNPEDPVALVVGFIADAQRVTAVRNLLSDLLELANEPGLAGLDVVVLENVRAPTASSELRAVIESARGRGLRIHLIDRDRHVADARLGRILDAGASAGERLAIAPARTVLQSYLYTFARHRRGAVVWIPDDDVRLDPLVSTPRGLQRCRRPIVPQIQHLRRTGADIVIGSDTGAAPLPFASTLRVQLVDLVATLHVLANLEPTAPMPTSERRHAALRAGRRDDYYDLSRSETDRLESPFVASPAEPTEVAAQTFERIAARAHRILAGEQVFRPLVVDAASGLWVEAGSGLFRGGNTLVFDVDALADTPNVASVFDGATARGWSISWSSATKKGSRAGTSSKAARWRRTKRT